MYYSVLNKTQHFSFCSYLTLFWCSLYILYINGKHSIQTYAMLEVLGKLYDVQPSEIAF